MTWEVRQGDCLELLRAIPDGSIDAVVTDPPYGMNLQPQRGLTKSIANDTRRDAKAMWWSFAQQCYRVAKDDTAHIFFGRWSEAWAKDVLSEWFTVKGCIVWKKNVFGIGYYLRPQWELAWYCHKGTPKTPETAQSDVWDCPRVHRPVHSCEKPSALLKRAVEFVSPVGGTVLDPFTGVSPCGVACVQSGRNFIGMELDAGYCETAIQRIAAAKRDRSEQLVSA
jgi:DNA modification methylase